MIMEERVSNLSRCIKEFKECIDSLPAKLFLRKMNDWSPRDVLAHLIGWNRYTIEGCQETRRGEAPSYFIDPGEDFNKVNAVSVQKYHSTDKGELVDELEASAHELKQFLLSLDSVEWEADYGVKYGEGPVTIKNSVDVLIHDYLQHREQIKKWAQTADSA